MQKFNLQKNIQEYKLFDCSIFQKILIIVCFDLIMLLILNMTIVKNYNKEITIHAEEIKKLKVQNHNYSLRMTEIKNIQYRLEMLNLDIPRLTNMFFMVDKLMANNKLKLIDMLPTEVETIGSLSFQDLQINAIGEYFGLIKFMTELNKLRIYFSIPACEIFKLQNNEQEDKVIKLKLKIRLYYPNLS